MDVQKGVQGSTLHNIKKATRETERVSGGEWKTSSNRIDYPDRESHHFTKGGDLDRST